MSYIQELSGLITPPDAGETLKVSLAADTVSTITIPPGKTVVLFSLESEAFYTIGATDVAAPSATDAIGALVPAGIHNFGDATTIKMISLTAQTAYVEFRDGS